MNEPDARGENTQSKLRKLGAGDFGLAERAEREVSRAILGFADYLIKHRFEDIEGY